MDEPEPDIEQIIEKIIQAKLFNQAEQMALANLFKEKGASEAFFAEAKTILETAVKREARKGQAIMADFQEQIAAVERTMRQQRASHLAELENQLTQVPDDDFARRGKLIQEHSQLVLGQYGALEQAIKDIAAKILVEQIKIDQ